LLRKYRQNINGSISKSCTTQNKTIFNHFAAKVSPIGHLLGLYSLLFLNKLRVNNKQTCRTCKIMDYGLNPYNIPVFVLNNIYGILIKHLYIRNNIY